MSDQPDHQPAKTPLEAVVEHAVDALVYAPIGLLFDGASLFPQLIDKGRNQVTMARLLGKFAVEQGRGEATKAAAKLQDQAAGLLDLLAGAAAPLPADAAVKPPARPPSRPSPRSGANASGPARQAARKVAGVAPTPNRTSRRPQAAAVPTAASLAIPDYDGLSASHVVNRLAGLAPAELEAVRSYEAAHRGRKTILSKVAQLQTA